MYYSYNDLIMYVLYMNSIKPVDAMISASKQSYHKYKWLLLYDAMHNALIVNQYPFLIVTFDVPPTRS